ncbi:MAG: DUF4178 domain-containing protein [Bacteroidota bacterium]
MDNWNCPTCGAPLEVEHRFVQMVTCDFCSNVALLRDNHLEATGREAALIDMPTKLFLEATGTIAGRGFRTLGRLQYQFEDGVWQEWYLLFDDGGRGWLVEDGGTFTLYDKETVTADLPAPEHVRVGSTVQVDAFTVFVTEKGHATIAGGEGQLGFALIPGETIQYVDGTANGLQVTIEYSADEVEFMAGQELPADAIEVTDPYGA